MTTMRAATALLMLLSSASATVAQIQELQRSEWPAQVNLDVSDNIRDCEAAGGRLVRARNYACYISPEDCMRKGDNWKVGTPADGYCWKRYHRSVPSHAVRRERWTARSDRVSRPARRRPRRLCGGNRARQIDGLSRATTSCRRSGAIPRPNSQSRCPGCRNSRSRTMRGSRSVASGEAGHPPVAGLFRSRTPLRRFARVARWFRQRLRSVEEPWRYRRCGEAGHLGLTALSAGLKLGGLEVAATLAEVGGKTLETGAALQDRPRDVVHKAADRHARQIEREHRTGRPPSSAPTRQDGRRSGMVAAMPDMRPAPVRPAGDGRGGSQSARNC